jgi:hypothetical protein
MFTWLNLLTLLYSVSLLTCADIMAACWLLLLYPQFFTMDSRGCGNSQAVKMGVDDSRLGGL